MIWSLLTSQIGRLIGVGAIALTFGFYQGWSLKAKFDRSATLQAIVAKQRIDLDALKQKEADDAATIATLATDNDANQERIRALSQTTGACVADDAAAGRLRAIR